MSKHTPEPWVLFEVGDGRPYLCPASDSDKTSVLTVIEEDGVMFAAVYKEADARRIVACVNACAGLETETLENITMLGETLLDRFELRNRQEAELTSKRDDLLAALHDAATSLETIQLRSFGEDSFLDSKPEMRSYAGSRAAVAREAIAKVKGGAA